MSEPHVPLTRRALREAGLREPASVEPAPARHVRRPRLGLRAWVALAGAVVLVAGSATAVTAALTAPDAPSPAAAIASEPEGEVTVEVLPMPADGLPTPQITAQAAAQQTLCDDPDMVAALAGGDDAAVIAAAGGGEGFRLAVAAGTAPCLRLDDPEREWVVVNKIRPYSPIDFGPTTVRPEGVRAVEDATLRPAAAAAVTAMVRAAADAGVGEIGMESAFRSYKTQQSTYRGHVSDRGVAGADLVSARPGFSEHQSGLAVDVVPCTGSCRTIDDLAASPQGAWVAEHAWEYGWIVRYTAGRTDVTGYEPEPWHLRYIGPELAKAYHDGGFTTLEEFFGLPAAPTYAD
ncbi:M15 family metallopeptidase [Microbacterium sp. NPDC091313]